MPKTGGKSRQAVIERRTWGGFLVLLLAVTASAVAVVYSTHSSRHLLNDLQVLERERNALQVEWGQLLLEHSSLVSQGRIEGIAAAQLEMKVPAMENVVVVLQDNDKTGATR